VLLCDGRKRPFCPHRAGGHSRTRAEHPEWGTHRSLPAGTPTFTRRREASRRGHGASPLSGLGILASSRWVPTGHPKPGTRRAATVVRVSGVPKGRMRSLTAGAGWHAGGLGLSSLGSGCWLNSGSRPRARNPQGWRRLVFRRALTRASGPALANSSPGATRTRAAGASEGAPGSPPTPGAKLVPHELPHFHRPKTACGDPALPRTRREAAGPATAGRGQQRPGRVSRPVTARDVAFASRPGLASPVRTFFILLGVWVVGDLVFSFACLFLFGVFLFVVGVFLLFFF